MSFLFDGMMIYNDVKYLQRFMIRIMVPNGHFKIFLETRDIKRHLLYYVIYAVSFA